MTFSAAIKKYITDAPARTENGMKARASTGDAVLNYFGKAGSARGKDLSPEFTSAFVEHEDLALRALLWTRDIRGGAGERQQFRTLLTALEESNPKAAASIMEKIPELGRWDDLFTYQNPLNRKLAFNLIQKALGEGNALCAKWMPRKGQVAAELRNFMGLSPKAYRKLIVGLSKTVETQMCAKDWDNINFSQVPSVASARYQKAFGRNAKEAYSKYLDELSKPAAQRDPKVKINAGAVYPYDVIKSVQRGNVQAADAQWEALPNFIGDAKIMPLVDVSGSMGSLSSYGGNPTPMAVAVSLGLYISEKNTSDFKDTFITFSSSPEVVKLKGTLSERLRQMMGSNWGTSTNLHAAFELILDIAVKGNVDQSDMPEMLLILSDMQFDQCTRFDDSAQEMIKRKYEAAGYEVPKIVFWNLRAAANSPVRYDDRGVCHISGFAPAIMKSVLADDLEDFTPYNVMLKTLMQERYNIN